jgi:hypothetical protein
MLEIKYAKLILKAIKENTATSAFPVTLEDVCRMQPVPVVTGCSGHTVLGTQCGDVTILVWVNINETLGVCVRSVKAQCW